VLNVTQSREADAAQEGGCDILVNCEGNVLGMDAIRMKAHDEWTNMHNNVLVALQMTQLLLPRLMASQEWRVNVTPTVELAGDQRGGDSCAAKSAQHGLIQSSRLEKKDVKVRVSEVLSGKVHTPEFRGSLGWLMLQPANDSLSNDGVR
jgi:NADP-dependent 3-hydroxy acid dehydrogenase YdfG